MAIDMPERSLTGDNGDYPAFDVDAFDENDLSGLNDLIAKGMAAEAEANSHDIEIGIIDEETPPVTIAIEQTRRNAQIALADVDASPLFSENEKKEFKSGERASEQYAKVPILQPPIVANVIYEDRILPSGDNANQRKRISELREYLGRATAGHYDTTVVVSEMVTNKFRNRPGTIGRLVVGDVKEGMAIICYDTIQCSPEELEAQRREKGYAPTVDAQEVFKDDAEHGRGLVVVSGYASQYGRWETEEGGNCFWAILPRESSDGVARRSA